MLRHDTPLAFDEGVDDASKCDVASKCGVASKCAGESASNSLGEEDEGDYKIDFAQRLELASADWFGASRVVCVP